MNAQFQEYLRAINIQHVTKDVVADNQLALVDSKMAQVKRHILMRMAQESDFMAEAAGAPSWAEFSRTEPGAEEPDWHPFFTEAVEKLNNKKIDYLMVRSVSQTFREDGRPKSDIGPGMGLRNQAVYMQTQRGKDGRAWQPWAACVKVLGRFRKYSVRTRKQPS